MSWTAPRTWVTGEVVTSTIMNAHIRDDIKALAGMTILTRAGAGDGGAPVTWDTVVVDDLGGASIGGHPTYFQAPYDGHYFAFAFQQWTGATGTMSATANIERLSTIGASIEFWASNGFSGESTGEPLAVAGAGRMLAGERLQVNMSIGATGSGGTATPRFVIHGAGGS